MSKPISLARYQKMVNEWIASVGSHYFPPTTNVCLLVEEVGEVSRLISRSYGEQRFKPGEEPADLKEALADELADVLFILTCIANDLDINLNDAVHKNFNKKNARDKDRYRDVEPPVQLIHH